MASAINPVTIFLPMLAVVLLTIIAFFRMASARANGLKESPRDPAYYRAHLGPPEPENVVAAVRHYGNLLELPLLFYVGCLSAFVLGAVSVILLLFAWGYVAARWVQSLVHMTYNNPLHRGIAFVVGWLFLIALWVTIAIAIVHRL
jgi:hypothetical protein